MKIIGIYLVNNVSDKEQLIPQVKGKPILREGKKIGKILEAKINKDGNIEWEGIIHDKKYMERLKDPMNNYSIKIVGEE